VWAFFIFTSEIKTTHRNNQNELDESLLIAILKLHLDREDTRKVELTNKEAERIKLIYNQYHAGVITPEQALDELELVINEEN
jgi:hypothetical protein